MARLEPLVPLSPAEGNLRGSEGGDKEPCTPHIDLRLLPVQIGMALRDKLPDQERSDKKRQLE